MQKKQPKKVYQRPELTKEELQKRKANQLQYIIGLAKWMADDGIPFTLSSTHGNYTLKSKHITRKSFGRNTTITGKELGYINKVRHYVKKLDLITMFPKQYFEADVQYVECDPKLKNQVFTDIVEIDIDQAYWETARLLGVISEEIYDIGMSGEISKQARMVALGSLAKKTYHYTFHGQRLIKAEEERSLDTENVWFTICKRVADVMQEIKKIMGEDYLFYWVDGVYVKNNPEVIEKVQSIIAAWGYNSKIKPIHSIECDKIYCFVNEDAEKQHVRRFAYVSPKTKNTLKRDLHLLDLCNQTLGLKKKS